MSVWCNYQGDTNSSPAQFSGFTWRHDHRCFVITNWHNVTGLHPNSGTQLGSFRPNRIRFAYWSSLASEGGVTKNGFIESDHDLYPDGRPGWQEHPCGRSVDLVAMPINPLESDGWKIVTLNERRLNHYYTPCIGDDCFVLGYPEGFTGPSNTPIWERASIASEPDLGFGGDQVFLIDTIGNRGLSGSPVIATGSAVESMANGGYSITPGRWHAFLGVYAGRMGDKGVGAQLGRVWKKEQIDEVCQNSSGNPEHPHI